MQKKKKTVFMVSDWHKQAFTVTEADFGFKRKRNCIIRVSKTKALVSCAVFRFSHDAARIIT